MRELKFRSLVIKSYLDNLGPNMHLAGVSEYEEMIVVHDISFANGAVDYVTDSDGEEYSGKYLKAVLQYTGLKDKNGREIYEGDIVKGTLQKGFDYMPNTGVIRYGFMGFVVSTHVKDYLFAYFELGEYEVIGNIYENPELLGDDK